MDFSRPKPCRPAEPALPMINVVFLLLIFFLMSAQIAPPPPFDIAAPQADSADKSGGDRVLYISAAGELAYDGARGEAVWGALSAIDDRAGTILLIRADAGLPATEVAGVLDRLTQLGLDRIRLATTAK